MDLGKLVLPLGSTYHGVAEQALQDIFIAFKLLGTELARMPGTGYVEASAAVTAGKAVAIVNGKVKHADAATNLPAIGVAMTNASTGQRSLVMLGCGLVTGLSGLTANSSVYLGNAGALVFTKPGSGMIQGIGYALSTTELFVTISQP